MFTVGIRSPLKADYTNDAQPNNLFSQNDSRTDSTLTKEMEALHLVDSKFICMHMYLHIIFIGTEKYDFEYCDL